MDATQIEACGKELYAALRRGHTVPPLSERWPDITIEDAYRISRHLVELRERCDGERIVGKKIGVTSPAVQEMLGVFQPDFGFLTDRMVYANDARVPIAGQLIQPRAEAEIAFQLHAELRGPGVDEAQVLAATEYITPCFEIVDSRIRNWEIRIQDTIADNASCGVYLLGEGRADPNALKLPEIEVRVFKNGEFLSSGLGAAVQGNPLTAVAWLANTLGQFGIPLGAGETILSGSLVPLAPVQAGDRFELQMAGVGSACVCFER